MLHNFPRKNPLVNELNEFLSFLHFCYSFPCFPYLELEMTSHGFGADHPDDDDDEYYSEDEEFGRTGRPNKSSINSGHNSGHSRIMEEEYDIVGFERYKRQREKEKSGALQLSGKNPIHNNNNNNSSYTNSGSGNRGALPFLRKNTGGGSGGRGGGYGNLPGAEDDDEYGIVDE
jgi:hypothetical protein